VNNSNESVTKSNMRHKDTDDNSEWRWWLNKQVYPSVLCVINKCFVSSRLDYCNSTLVRVADCVIWKLQRVRTSTLTVPVIISILSFLANDVNTDNVWLTSIAGALVVIEREADGAATAAGPLSWDAVMLTLWTVRRLTSSCFNTTQSLMKLLMPTCHFAARNTAPENL